LFCGDLTASARRKLAETLGAAALFVAPLSCIRRAGLLAELASQRLERGEADNPLTLEPLYLRRPHITVSTRQRPQLLGSSRDTEAPSASQGTGSMRQAFRAGDEHHPLNRQERMPESQDGLLNAKASGMVHNERWTEPVQPLDRPRRFASDD